MRGLKFRLNMSVLFLGASLVVIAAAVWIEYYLSQDYIKYIRSTLLQNQIAVSHTLLTGLEQTLPPAGWQDVAARLPKLVSTTQSVSMVLIHPDGSVLASEPGPPGAVPVDPELVAAALDKGQAARWVSKNHLSVAVNHSPISAVLVREIDLSEQFASLQLASTRLLISVGVIALGIGLLLLTLNWWVAVRPLNQLRKAAEAVSEGDLTRRVPPALVSELEDVSLAFNRMVEQLIGQQRWLAQTVQSARASWPTLIRSWNSARACSKPSTT